jgi:hypothetical protein
LSEKISEPFTFQNCEGCGHDEAIEIIQKPKADFDELIAVAADWDDDDETCEKIVLLAGALDSVV